MKKIIAASVLLFAVFSSFQLSAKPLVVEASVKDNPTIYFKGVSGNEALNSAVRSFLHACGWFDLTANPKADYQLSGRVAGGVFFFNLTLGGAPVGSWQLPVSGYDERRLAGLEDGELQALADTADVVEIRDAEGANPEFKRAFKKNLEIL